jgi:DNA-directed RNA polymerase specialized sigma subunit
MSALSANLPAVADDLERVIAAVARVEEAEKKLAAARKARREAMQKANKAGVSMTRIGAALGVSRQRVAQMLEE